MSLPPPLQFFFLLFAGWVNRHQEAVIEYLKEENRVLRELHGTKRLRFNDDQRRRLAVKGKALGRKLLGEVGSLVTPDTILGWYRKLIAKKYDGSQHRRPGRPRVPEEIACLVVRIASDKSRLWIHSPPRRPPGSVITSSSSWTSRPGVSSSRGLRTMLTEPGCTRSPAT